MSTHRSKHKQLGLTGEKGRLSTALLPEYALGRNEATANSPPAIYPNKNYSWSLPNLSKLLRGTLQWRAVKKVQGKKAPQRATAPEKDAGQGLLRAHKAETLLISPYKKQPWNQSSLLHCSPLQDKMHSDTKKARILPMDSQLPAGFCLKRRKIPFAQLYRADRSEARAGESRGTAKGKSPRNTKKRTATFALMSLKRQFFSFPKASAVST